MIKAGGALVVPAAPGRKVRPARACQGLRSGRRGRRDRMDGRRIGGGGGPVSGSTYLVDEELRRAALAAKGFMPEDEGDALYAAAAGVPAGGLILEVGTYCGKS